MRIGVFTALWQGLPFEVALDKAAAAGVTAVEIGCDGYPGSPTLGCNFDPSHLWWNGVSALRLVGYDYVISIEHEDALMSQGEGLAKGIALLKEACVVEKPGEMFWT